jgi:alkylation response protein AidB-like acyl-CoA dehydrogenase
MYSLSLTPEQIEIRDTVRDFVRTEIKPLAEMPRRMEAVDRTPMTDALAQASALGLRTLTLPEGVGGAGADQLTLAIVAEELAFGDPDTAAILAETSWLLGEVLGTLMTPAQRERHLAAFLGDHGVQLAWAHGRTGTSLGVNYHRPVDTTRMTVTAIKRGSDYVLNGTSTGVVNAPLAGLIAVNASLDPSAPGYAGLVTLIVPRNASGIAIAALPSGRFHGSMGDITFKDCKVAAADQLETGGVRAALARASASPVPAAINLGIGRAALEAAIDYSKLRVQGGRPIIEHQAIALKLADIAIRLEVARQSIWSAAWASDHPEAVADRSQSDLPLAAIARLFTAETVYRCAKDAAECFGAMGVMRDIPMHKHIGDARICLHAGNGLTDGKLAIAEAVAGFRRA